MRGLSNTTETRTTCVLARPRVSVHTHGLPTDCFDTSERTQWGRELEKRERRDKRLEASAIFLIGMY